MDESLWMRAVAAFVVDGSLSIVCGLLLASHWREKTAIARRGREVNLLGLFAGVLVLGSCLQLVLLAVSFGGESSPRAVLRVLPDVCGMHVGAAMAWLAVAAGVLCAMSWIRSERLRNGLCGALLVVCLGLHGSSGHAAVDGMVSLSEGLQWVHLLAMAVWSGGVLVSGLLVVPRMSLDSPRFAQGYLGRLSLASTWAVGVVVASGVVKGYRATDGSFGALRSSSWGVLLLVKAAVVVVTLLLGARNRWLLRSKREWDGRALQRVTATLRMEAVAMLAVLLLSAWLANSPPPMD